MLAPPVLRLVLAVTSSTARVLKIVVACPALLGLKRPVPWVSSATRCTLVVAPMQHQHRLDLSKPNSLSYVPGTAWKPTLTRFHALIDVTRKVKSDNSFSDSCVRTCS